MTPSELGATRGAAGPGSEASPAAVLRMQWIVYSRSHSDNFVSLLSNLTLKVVILQAGRGSWFQFPFTTSHEMGQVSVKKLG